MVPWYYDPTLVSDVNRKKDVLLHKGGSVIDPPNGMSERKFIDRLFELDEKYPDGLDYDYLPDNDEEGYNSNSYTSGLLEASGAKVPQPSVNTPGWNKPVPRKSFE